MKFKDALDLERIVFYDGECGFCNAVVNFILKYRKVDFYFIALQSESAQVILSKYDIKIDMNTLYLIENKKLYDRSSASLRIFKYLTRLFPFLYYGGLILPKVFRDYLYMRISKYRHKIQPQYCILPKTEDRKFFIDDIIAL